MSLLPTSFYDFYFILFYFIILVCLSAGMCMHHVYAVPTVARRRRNILWNWRYRWL